MSDMDRFIEAAAALAEAGDDMIRASNTMMLILAGDLSVTKWSLEVAVRRALDARNAWDNANREYRAAREAITKGTPPAFATSA